MKYYDDLVLLMLLTQLYYIDLTHKMV